MTIFDGRKALWQWEFSQQAEKDIAAAATTARDLAGATVLLVKAMDGMDWMAAFDPTGYGSLAQLQADAQRAADFGVTLVPWVVPHGTDPASEAAFHAELGSRLMVDVEPYPSFWTGPTENLPVYLRALRDRGVTELHISIDPRGHAVSAIGGLSSFAAIVTGIHPQVYWTDFLAPPLSVLPMIRALGGQAPVYPVFPGAGAAQDMADVWSLAQAAGCLGVSVWRLGSMDSAGLAGFKELTMVDQPSPDLTLEQRLTDLEATVHVLLDAINRLNDVLVKRFDGVRAALDPANPPA